MRESVELAIGQNVKTFLYRCDEYILRFSSLLLLSFHLFSSFGSKYIFLPIGAAVINNPLYSPSFATLYSHSFNLSFSSSPPSPHPSHLHI